ncbi:MAG TPA: Plug domain-containing protein [Longimicrobiaceae bacterium]|nr:Plug domain-containing protein [Longimicrobiaceae bacterium]
MVTDPINVGRRETLDLELLLASRAVPLSGVAVAVQAANRNRWLESRGFYDRQRKASGTFITRDAIEKRPASDLIEIFRGVRGFNLQPSRRGPGYFLVSNRDTRGCLPLVFLDGVELKRLPGDRTDVIYAVSPEHVEAIDAYPSRMAVPPQFQRPDVSCGAVLIWTR